LQAERSQSYRYTSRQRGLKYRGTLTGRKVSNLQDTLAGRERSQIYRYTSKQRGLNHIGIPAGREVSNIEVHNLQDIQDKLADRIDRFTGHTGRQETQPTGQSASQGAGRQDMQEEGSNQEGGTQSARKSQTSHT
jgi:hypothetical protein